MLSTGLGLTTKAVKKVPFTELDAAVRRSYFDTRRFGKSNQGHDYPTVLTETERRAVLEYLKTL